MWPWVRVPSGCLGVEAACCALGPAHAQPQMSSPCCTDCRHLPGRVTRCGACEVILAPALLPASCGGPSRRDTSAVRSASSPSSARLLAAQSPCRPPSLGTSRRVCDLRPTDPGRPPVSGSQRGQESLSHVGLGAVRAPRCTLRTSRSGEACVQLCPAGPSVVCDGARGRWGSVATCLLPVFFLSGAGGGLATCTAAPPCPTCRTPHMPHLVHLSGLVCTELFPRPWALVPLLCACPGLTAVLAPAQHAELRVAGPVLGPASPLGGLSVAHWWYGHRACRPHWRVTWLLPSPCFQNHVGTSLLWAPALKSCPSPPASIRPAVGWFSEADAEVEFGGMAPGKWSESFGHPLPEVSRPALKECRAASALCPTFPSLEAPQKGLRVRGVAQHPLSFPPQYYAECHGVIYVIDSTDEERLAESKRAFGGYSVARAGRGAGSRQG